MCECWAASPPFLWKERQKRHITYGWLHYVGMQRVSAGLGLACALASLSHWHTQTLEQHTRLDMTVHASTLQRKWTLVKIFIWFVLCFLGPKKSEPDETFRFQVPPPFGEAFSTCIGFQMGFDHMLGYCDASGLPITLSLLCFPLDLNARLLLTCNSLHTDVFLFCGSDICQPFSPWPGCNRAAPAWCFGACSAPARYLLAAGPGPRWLWSHGAPLVSQKTHWLHPALLSLLHATRSKNRMSTY